MAFGIALKIIPNKIITLPIMVKAILVFILTPHLKCIDKLWFVLNIKYQLSIHHTTNKKPRLDETDLIYICYF